MMPKDFNEWWDSLQKGKMGQSGLSLKQVQQLTPRQTAELAWDAAQAEHWSLGPLRRQNREQECEGADNMFTTFKTNH